MQIGWRSFLYFTLTAACIGGALNPDLWIIHLWTKPALMLCLLLFIFLSGPWKSMALKATTIAAVLCSLAGDVLLMNDNQEGFFIYGLLSFLLAHLFYIINFLVAKPSFIEISFLKRKPWAIFITAAYVGLMFTQLKEGAGSLSGAILGYAFEEQLKKSLQKAAIRRSLSLTDEDDKEETLPVALETSFP